MPVNIYDIFARELPKSARENVQKSARERTPLPVNILKKCPWTQKSARETCWKNDVHGHFWCSRGKKKHWTREGYIFLFGGVGEGIALGNH